MGDDEWAFVRRRHGRRDAIESVPQVPPIQKYGGLPVLVCFWRHHPLDRGLLYIVCSLIPSQGPVLLLAPHPQQGLVLLACLLVLLRLRRLLLPHHRH